MTPLSKGRGPQIETTSVRDTNQVEANLKASDDIVDNFLSVRVIIAKFGYQDS